MKVKEFKETITSRLSEYGIRPDIRSRGYSIHGDEENDEYRFICVHVCVDNKVYHFTIDDTVPQESLEYEKVLIDDIEIYREYIPHASWFCSIQDSINRIVTNHAKVSK